MNDAHTPVSPLALPLDHVALFLDLDGTLAPFTDVPQGVGPDPQRNDLLHQLTRRLKGRLAVISGRSIADLDRILEHQVLCLAGSHGLQRRDAFGHVEAVPPHPGVRVATAAFEDFAAARPGVLVEHKPLSVALHYRNAPQAEGDVQALAMELARATGLKLQFGTCVAELVTLGADKGQALTAFMREVPFSGVMPVFVGDDLTDEDGFRAAVDLGGYGILVGPPRPSRAQYRLESSAAVIEWLQDLLLTENLLLEYKL